MTYLFFILSSLFIFVSSEALAQSAVYQPCKEAKNTADVLSCIKKQHEDMQRELNQIYEELVALQEIRDEETVTALRDVQKSWIAYRDLECMAAEGREDTKSLKRIASLSCLTRLTRERIAHIREALEEVPQKTDQKVFLGKPRWINVLSDNYPEKFWRYRDYQEVDLNCDGVDEKVIAGMGFAQKEQGLAAQLQTFVAVVENMETGRPQTSLLALDDTAGPQGEKAGPLCGSDFTLRPVVPQTPIPRAKPVSANNGAAEKDTALQTRPFVDSCYTEIQVQDILCRSSRVFWNGSEFVVELMDSRNGVRH